MRYLIVIIFSFFLFSAYAQPKPSLMQQLEGRWISEDDKQFEVVFKGNTKQDYYGGKVESHYRYRIRKDSLIATDVNTGDVFNYSIMGLTSKSLTLMYLERGNLLKFRKKVATSTSPAKKPRN
jgi:hypothetical protein